MPLPFALLAVPSLLSSVAIPASIGGGLFAAASVSTLSTSSYATVAGSGLAAKAMVGSGKYVFPALAGLAAGGAICSNDKRVRALLAGTAALFCAGPIAGALAPILGSASTGTVISSLQGAALWNAALAKLGGGTLASGGGGVALGTANVSMTGGLAGWMTGK